MRDQDRRAVARAARRRSKISASPRTSSCAVGSSSSTTPAPSFTAHSARASATRCHWPARQIGAVVVAARQDRVESASLAAPAASERLEHDVIGRTARRDVVAQRQLEANEVLKHRGQARAPRRQVELAHVHAVDLDRAGLRVVEPAQQLGERRLSCAVLSDDGERRAGGYGEVEAFENGRAARVRKGHVTETNLARGQAGGRRPTGRQRAGGRHRRLEAQHRGHRRRRAVHRPVQSAERDERGADRALRVRRQTRRGRGRPLRPRSPERPEDDARWRR